MWINVRWESLTAFAPVAGSGRAILRVITAHSVFYAVDVRALKKKEKRSSPLFPWGTAQRHLRCARYCFSSARGRTHAKLDKDSEWPMPVAWLLVFGGVDACARCSPVTYAAVATRIAQSQWGYVEWDEESEEGEIVRLRATSRETRLKYFISHSSVGAQGSILCTLLSWSYVIFMQLSRAYDFEYSIHYIRVNAKLVTDPELSGLIASRALSALARIRLPLPRLYAMRDMRVCRVAFRSGDIAWLVIGP